MHLVKTLSAIALFGAAIPSTFALSVKDDQLSVALKFQVQERATLDATGKADSTAAGLPAGATSDDWDVNRGQAGKSEFARFDLRRARIGFAVKYGDDWTGNILIRAENTDRFGANGAPNSAAAPGATTTNNNGRTVQLYYANAARTFKVDDDSAFDLHGGLDKPFNAESSISSTTYMMPEDRIVAALEEVRGIGAGAGWRSPFIDVGVDIQNNLTGVKDAQAGNDQGDEQTNGYLYSARIQFAPGKQWHPKTRQESYAGKEGTGALLGFDVQVDQHNLSDNGAAATYNDITTTTFGPDLLVHWNYLTFLAEYRFRDAKVKTVTDATGADVSDNVKGKYYDIGLAYAIPVSDMFLEPSVRYGARDMNKDFDSDAPYLGGAASAPVPAGSQNVSPSTGANQDIGADGKTIEVGLSLYINGHNNKLQLSYENWKAETGNAKANIIRLQHQWAF